MTSPRVSLALQIAALFVAGTGVVFGLLAAEWAAFPGPSGEWAALAEPAAFVVGVPTGLVALLLLRLAGRASGRLRRAALAAAAVTLALPLLVSALWHARY